MNTVSRSSTLRNAGWIHLVVAGCLLAAALAEDVAGAAPFDYAKPALVTGTLYGIGSHRTRPLFTFRRTATVSNDLVYVRREFFTTNNSAAAREDVVYRAGELVSYQMHEFQAGVSGAITITSDPKAPTQKKIAIVYGQGLKPSKGDAAPLAPDTVIDDNLYPFLLEHWDDLMQGRAVKFQFVSLEHQKTYGFRFIRNDESTQNGRAVVRIKMEPTGFLVRKLVAPLFFTLEKDSPHRILSYTGRTTPRVKDGNKWQYLDAETVLDW